jgi:hypothetical protein
VRPLIIVTVVGGVVVATVSEGLVGVVRVRAKNHPNLQRHSPFKSARAVFGMVCSRLMFCIRRVGSNVTWRMEGVWV